MVLPQLIFNPNLTCIKALGVASFRSPAVYQNLHKVLNTTNEAFPFPIKFTVSSLFVGRVWLREWDSNPRPTAYEAGELPLLYPAI